MSARLMVVGHDVDPDTVLVQAGTVVDWARERDLEVVPVVSGGPAPLPDPRETDAITVLGSPEGAWDDTVPWLAGERAFLDAAVAADVPILGICFGGQVLARTLGGRVGPGPQPENGFGWVRSEDPDVVAEGPWMEFHFDSFTVPPGARRLAVSDVCDQAFRHGRHVGVQFHPEVTADSVETWIARWTGTPLADRLAARGITDDGLRASVVEHGPASRAHCRVLFDAFATGAGLLDARVA